ncbi:MAG: CotH kinase family protein [Betaproteobacteria bacterium]|nr:CotH kinase family protein [Betaproteobacteria bacterium]
MHRQTRLDFPALWQGFATAVLAVLLLLLAPLQDASAAQPVDTGLPVVEIWTDGNVPITSRDIYLSGRLKITDGTKMKYGAGLYDGAIEVRGRGNSTWDMPKKGYRIKLASKTQLLDMPADDDWLLLANYADKTLMRNHVAMELSRRFGMAYTPRLRYVELYLNGEYRGNYLLGEHIKVARDRVNITKMEAADNAEPAVSGGYLLEIDAPDYLAPDDVYFMTRWQIIFNIKSPSNSKITAAQKAWVANHVQQVEDVIYSNYFDDPVNGYARYVDVDSLIDWFLINEIFKNQDARWYSSVYWHKDRGGKLRMGPAWDFDLGAGNVDFSRARYPTGWWVRQSDWIEQMFYDPLFQAKVKNRWNQLKRTQIDTIFDYVDQTAVQIDASQKQNFKRWPILDKYVWPNAVVKGTYPKEVKYLKDWLKTRIQWMDKKINK